MFARVNMQAANVTAMGNGRFDTVSADCVFEREEENFVGLKRGCLKWGILLKLPKVFGFWIAVNPTTGSAIQTYSVCISLMSSRDSWGATGRDRPHAWWVISSKVDDIFQDKITKWAT